MLRIGTWNVRTLTVDGEDSLLLKEPSKARISIMGLQEVRWPGIGEKKVDGYNFLWSGLPETAAERRGGVALVLDPPSASSLVEWNSLSDR